MLGTQLDADCTYYSYLLICLSLMAAHWFWQLISLKIFEDALTS